MSEARAIPLHLETPASARTALRGRLAEIEPGLTLLAEGFLGEAAEIDFLARDGQGRVAVVLLGAVGADLELLGRGLAQAEWARRRIKDWLQLAPNLKIDADADTRVLLVCPAFQPETRLAAASLERGRVVLVTNHAGPEGSLVRLEPIPGARDSRHPDAVAPSPFRSDLSDEDLMLSPDERRALLG